MRLFGVDLLYDDIITPFSEQIKVRFFEKVFQFYLEYAIIQ